MACSSRVRVAVFTSLCAFFFGTVIQAQSQQDKPQTCSPPCVSAGELREMTGKKVYPKMIVDDVKFDGPAHLPDSSEEPEIITETKQHMFDYGQEGLDEIMEIRIRGAWEEQGFFKVLVDGHTKVISSDSVYEHVIVTIHVDPGQQYRLGGVRFRSSDPDDRETLAFPREELRKLLPLQEGDIFNVAKIRESLDAMRKLYDSHGYINFVATPETEADDSTHRVSLVMELSEGKQFRVGKAEVFGLEPSEAELAAITARGRMLAEYDNASWHATDAVEALNPPKGAVGRYIAKKTDAGWVVVFGRFNETKDAFLIVYEAIQGSDPKEFTVKTYEPPRQNTGFFYAAAKSIEISLQNSQLERRPYNTCVLPLDSGEMYVYVFPAETKAEVYLLGGDTRFLVSADGSKIIEKRQLHKTILESNRSVPSEKKQVSGLHTHVLSDTPEDTDVFYVLRQTHPLPEYIGTKNGTYMVGTDGTIKRVQ